MILKNVIGGDDLILQAVKKIRQFNITQGKNKKNSHSATFYIKWTCYETGKNCKKWEILYQENNHHC